MRGCNATYKTSIRFEDFYKKGSHFHYPFGRVHPEQNTLEGVNQWFINKEVFPNTYTPERASTYFVSSTMLAEKNRLTDDANYDLKTNTAYHFDAHLFIYNPMIGLRKNRLKHAFIIFDANFTFPDLWKSPRGGFLHAEFDFEVEKC